MDGKPEGMGELVTKEFKYIGNFKVGKFVGGLTTPRTKKTLDSIDISANIVNEKIPDLADEFQNEQSITHQNKEESPIPTKSNVSNLFDETQNKELTSKKDQIRSYDTNINNVNYDILRLNKSLKNLSIKENKTEQISPLDESAAKGTESTANDEVHDLKLADQNEEPTTLQNKEALPESNVANVSGGIENSPIVEVENMFIQNLGGYYTGPTINGIPNGNGFIIYKDEKDGDKKYIGVFDNGKPKGDFTEYRKKGTDPEIWEETGRKIQHK